MLLVTFSVQQVFGDHPIYVGGNHKWYWGSTTVCYDTTPLNSLFVDGSYNQYSTVATELDNARSDWNDESSSFSFGYTSSSCDNTFSATALSGGLVGLTDPEYDWLGYVFEVDSWFDNSARDWHSGSGCSDSDPASLRYVATHEFGHWLVFGHAESDPSHSVMYDEYDCDGRTVQDDDAEELDDVY